MVEGYAHQGMLQWFLLSLLQAMEGQRFRPVGIANPLARGIGSYQGKIAAWPPPVRLALCYVLGEPTWTSVR